MILIEQIIELLHYFEEKNTVFLLMLPLFIYVYTI